MKHRASAKRFCLEEFKVDPIPDVLKQGQAASQNNRMNDQLELVNQAQPRQGRDQTGASGQ
jgi:hypothetical protein